MDLSISSIPNQQQVSNNSAQAGNVAPQTEPQRQDYTVQRVTSTNDTAKLEDNARDAESKKFNTLKSVAASYTGGDNQFLSDISFTIYNKNNNAQISNYEIRFTDLSSGAIQIKSEAALLAEAPSGELVSGTV